MAPGLIITVKLFIKHGDMNDMGKKAKEPSIIASLKNYDRLYAIGMSTISDTEYDNLKDKARASYPNDPYFKAVGSDTTDSRVKVKLPYVLGSLNKVKADGTCNKWLNETSDRIIVTPKLDGLSILVNFYNGMVEKAMLRGDGEYGFDITHKTKKFINPIDEKASLWLRGEILLSDLPPGYKNKRNAVAGIINDENSEHLDKLICLFYEHINSPLDSEHERLKMMNFFKIPTVEYEVCNNINEETLIEALKDFKSHYPDFLIDGLVLTRNMSERENVKYPDNKVAFKVNQEAVETTIRRIEWNTSRSGKVVPLVYVEPTDIDGVTVSKATGFNAEYIISNRLYNGSKITVCRSGDVIPIIVDIISFNDVPVSPTHCKSCNTELVMVGVNLVCENIDCPARTVKKLEHFIKTIGVMGVSEATLENLGVNSIRQLYELTVDDIMHIEGFGHKKAESIYTELREKLIMSKAKFLASIGIPGLGESIAELVVKNVPFENLWDTKDFSFIPGIGDIISDNIVKGLKEAFNTYVILSAYGMRFKEVSNDNDLSGKILTLTGNAPIKRDDLVRILENIGCSVKGISKKTNILVTNDVDSNSSKAQKAREFGIPFMSYDELMKKLNIVE